jgi:dihydrofolate synthase/folylpolyglutamate synthase
MILADFAAAEAALLPFMPKTQRRASATTEYMRQLMTYLGNPQNAVPAIHVAGTSGKTSTAYYAAALLQAAGKRVGLLTSPHVHAMNERVQIGLRPLPEAQFCRELGIFLEAVADSGIPVTYIEILYAFAFWEFARAGVEHMVIEVGIGGLLDPTNVMDRPDKVCVITDIGFDHMNRLGTTLGEIAANKAGIIGPGQKVFCYQQAAEVMAQLRAAARRYQADLHTFAAPRVPAAARDLPLFQQRNSFLAIQTVQAVLARAGRPKLAATAIARALAVPIPGRMEVIKMGSKTIIIDGAHNSQKLAALAASIATRYPARPVAAVIACKHRDEQDSIELLRALHPLVVYCICAPLPAGSPPSHSVVELQAAASAIGMPYDRAQSFEAAVEALLARPEPVLLITGSLYMVAAAEQLLARQ